MQYFPVRGSKNQLLMKLQDDRSNVNVLAVIFPYRQLLHDHLSKDQITARWILFSALKHQCRRRGKFARWLLDMCGDYPKPILESIITQDEIMILLYNPISKRKSMDWWRNSEICSGRNELRPQKFFNI